MTMRICSATIIPALWCSGILLLSWVGLSPAAPAPQAKSARKAASRKKAAAAPAPVVPGGPATLASLVRAYRQAPTPAHRSAVTAYAAAHPKEAASAQLGLAVAAYEQKDFPGAIAGLQKLKSKFPQIADYVGFYLAASRVEANQMDGVARDLLPTRSMELPSPLAPRSWILEARALQPTQPADAVRLLRDHYAALPQPEGDLILGDCSQAAGDPVSAAQSYQRVFYQYTTGDAATRSAAALIALKDTMGDKYPQPSAGQLLRRGDRYAEQRDYLHARAAYLELLDRPPSLERDQARVRIGAADYFSGRTDDSIAYLAGLEVAPSEADAERLYYLEEGYRHKGEDEEMHAALKKLSEKHVNSPWRLKALISAANRYLVINRPDDYVPLYKEAAKTFAGESVAGTAHWKVTFNAWLHGKSDAGSLLREHLTRYPNHSTTGAALYFLGRDAEEKHEPGEARAYYERLSKTFENHYYAMRARERLARPEIQAATPAAKALEYLATLALAQVKPVSTEPTRPTSLRIERSRLLRGAGLNDLADSELRFGARTDGQPTLLGMEMASSADTPHQAMRMMKGMAPEYLSLPIAAAPRQYWELLFPLPYRSELMADAAAHGVDPYLMAGLIRQESEFDPNALSPAQAYGLAQVRPVTGRQFAPRAGVVRFTARMLYQPAVNLKIGASILRWTIDQNGGRLEQTLASYNAGPGRLADWSTWSNFREPAEFVESIPFTETRDYVQAVLRNADIYRRLYE
ncbi:MAG TPA: transglycosylase SLT domain-containing protein [Candidatus Sulfopaludibacter sp.]|jgi:soluble lytic murein transglycosylase|nr:transglycosylase SLT domain-containing protein [Candidatus Sulfopaludibacter sp.]